MARSNDPWGKRGDPTTFSLSIDDQFIAAPTDHNVNTLTEPGSCTENRGSEGAAP
jgi:hypothetical protein